MEATIWECLTKEQQKELLKEYPDLKIPKDSFKPFVSHIESREELAFIMEKPPHKPKREPSW